MPLNLTCRLCSFSCQLLCLLSKKNYWIYHFNQSLKYTAIDWFFWQKHELKNPNSKGSWDFPSFSLWHSKTKRREFGFWHLVGIAMSSQFICQLPKHPTFSVTADYTLKKPTNQKKNPKTNQPKHPTQKANSSFHFHIDIGGFKFWAVIFLTHCGFSFLSWVDH